MIPPSPGAPTLVLVPTARERDGLRARGAFPAGTGLVELAGFGPVEAGVTAAARLALLAPRRVLLTGIAGTYDAERLPIGAAATFAEVALAGVGAGEGDAHRSAAELGFTAADAPEWLPLAAAPGTAGRLLTVCAAARAPETAALRRARHAGALAEDMEAYGVALAARRAGPPLTVVRGISNRAGDPPAAWRVEDALDAAAPLVRAWLEETR